MTAQQAHINLDRAVDLALRTFHGNDQGPIVSELTCHKLALGSGGLAPEIVEMYGRRTPAEILEPYRN